ncbi:hypothetical protein NQ317_012691, partial [Molorchus minor]
LKTSRNKHIVFKSKVSIRHKICLRDHHFHVQNFLCRNKCTTGILIEPKSSRGFTIPGDHEMTLAPISFLVFQDINLKFGHGVPFKNTKLASFPVKPEVREIDKSVKLFHIYPLFDVSKFQIYILKDQEDIGVSVISWSPGIRVILMVITICDLNNPCQSQIILIHKLTEIGLRKIWYKSHPYSKSQLFSFFIAIQFMARIWHTTSNYLCLKVLFSRCISAGRQVQVTGLIV